MMGAGGFLLYASVKGLHPWTLFLDAITGKHTSTSVNNVAGSGATAAAAGGAALSQTVTNEAVAQNPVGAAQMAAAAAAGGQ